MACSRGMVPSTVRPRASGCHGLDRGPRLGAQGRQHVLSVLGEGAELWRIFYPTSMTSDVYAEIRASDVQFIVVQRRLAGPSTGWALFDSSDPPNLVTQGVSPTALSKFHSAPGLQLVYDSAEISPRSLKFALGRSRMIPYLGTLVAQAERKAGHWGLWWIGIVSVACGLVAVLSPAAALRVPAALALVLVLPGYAVVARLTKAGAMAGAVASCPCVEHCGDHYHRLGVGACSPL